MSDIDVRVRTVIAEETGNAVAAIAPSTRFREDLGLDGEDLGYVLAEVESEFGIAFYGRDHAAARTVGDVIRLVEGHTASFARRRRR